MPDRFCSPTPPEWYAGGNEVIMDIPFDNAPGYRFRRRRGAWSVTGLFTRMGRGPRVQEDIPRLWASSGPEKG